MILEKCFSTFLSHGTLTGLFKYWVATFVVKIGLMSLEMWKSLRRHLYHFPAAPQLGTTGLVEKQPLKNKCLDVKENVCDAKIKRFIISNNVISKINDEVNLIGTHCFWASWYGKLVDWQTWFVHRLLNGPYIISIFDICSKK